MISARDMRPSIGERTSVNSRLRRAASSAGVPRRRCPRSPCWPWSRAGRNPAARSASARRDARRAGDSIRPAPIASARGGARPSRRFTSAWNGRGSMRNRSWPFLTRAPSVNCTESMKPLTRGRISTLSTACRRPGELLEIAKRLGDHGRDGDFGRGRRRPPARPPASARTRRARASARSRRSAAPARERFRVGMFDSLWRSRPA